MAITTLAFAIPVIAYLVLLSHYQVNAVLGDQWDNVGVLRQSYAHFPDWSSLWSQHTDNRLFFPNIIVLGLAHTVSFNIEVEEYISALMLFGSISLIIWTHMRRSPGVPLLFYCPVAFLMLTFAQWQNTLWGFQMAWYLVLLSLAVAISLLDRPQLTWLVVTAAALVAVVGSYSSVQGLLVWAVGLFMLYHRRGSWPKILAWVLAAGATTVQFFHNYVAPPSYLTLAREHSLDVAKFFVFAVGDVVGLQEKLGQPPNRAVLALGAFILISALLVLAIWGFRRDTNSGTPIGMALIVYGLLFDLFITEGRFEFGANAASQSRYTTYDVLVLVGLFLSLLSHASVDRSVPLPQDVGIRAGPSAWIRSHAQIATRGLLVVVLGITVLQVAVSTHYGILGARFQHAASVETATVTRNIDHESDARVRSVLYFVEPAGLLRVEARFLRSHHFSLFG